ncbi:MAG: PSD1 and planctomycete cytochrome C domain-containing protein [Planctomycetota bacterium]|nr:PSD1 and planctomycete cytochrome C domain-containing protein [Planctomycetota bacterium]
MKTIACLAAIVMLSAKISPAIALAADSSEFEFFEQKIRPVLVEHCYSCHSVGARDSKKLQGALLLDSANAISTGGESGAVLVKGKSAESLLIKALMYDGIEMPPAGKLPDDVIANFAKWIEMGAPDPRVGDSNLAPKRQINIEEGKTWWAFQPLREVASPNAEKPIDGYLWQAQHAHGLKTNHATSKEKLIRRAYFDLIGLPPTPEQVAAFVGDASPQAYEKVIDTLLASSAYGERWARHWLDAARFAESGGYEFDGFRPGAYHYRDWVIRALNQDMPYDEFVRLQLAGDLLAPDDIQAASATGFLVAGPYPGQITAKTVEGIRYDQLDDMMMTIGGSMMGLTLGCVRCHSHKYDPIPHEDYYALAASLARTVHGARNLDIDPAATERAIEQHRLEHEPLVAALHTFATNELPSHFAAWQKQELSKQPEPARWQSLEPVAMEAERSYLKQLPNGIIAHDGMVNPGTVIQQRGKKRKIAGQESYRLTFQTHQKNLNALRLDAFTDKSLPQKGPGLEGDGGFQLMEITLTANPIDKQSKEATQVVKLKPVYAANEDKDQPLAHAVDDKPATAWVVKTTAKKDNAAILEFESPIAGFPSGTELLIELKFRDAGIGRLRMSISVEANPATWAGDVSMQHVAELRAIVAANGQKLPDPIPDSLREPLARWFAPFDPENARYFHSVRDHSANTPRPKVSEVYTTIAGGEDVYFLRRGEVNNKQGKASPGFLQVLSRSNEPSKPAALQSPIGSQTTAAESVALAPDTAAPIAAAPIAAIPSDPRTALANWMTDIERGAGTLVARVIVNRLWQHHFGKGIVGTPNDFGAQGDPPTHPELLEFLANTLVRSEWKLKPLHRMIMLTDTYQQSHEITPENFAIDPTNKFLWHYQPQRLESESIRDALLAAGGNLDTTMFGPSVLENSVRRSVYLRVKRSELLPMMTMFDAPEPTQSIGARSVTTVPTQSLVMMNSPFVRQQAEKLFARIRPAPDAPLETSIDKGYEIALGRTPTATERSRMLAFIQQQRTADGSEVAKSTKDGLVEFCHVLLCLNEFVYID